MVIITKFAKNKMNHNRHAQCPSALARARNFSFGSSILSNSNYLNKFFKKLIERKNKDLLRKQQDYL